MHESLLNIYEYLSHSLVLIETMTDSYMKIGTHFQFIEINIKSFKVFHT
jgi:urease beta subunit